MVKRVGREQVQLTTTKMTAAIEELENPADENEQRYQFSIRYSNRTPSGFSDQGRRRFLKSGTAIECRRRSARAEGSCGGRAREGVIPPLVRGVRGISPENFFDYNMSVEAILMHFETIFACEIRLIVQAFHVAVFKCVLNPHH